MNKISIILLGFFIFLGCSQRVEEDTTTDVVELNGTSIQIDHNDRYVRKKGFLSGHEYATYYDFSYKISISPQDIVWKDRDEPREIRICSNVVTMYAIGEHLQYDRNETHHSIVKRYSRFIDKRYFFNLLGNSYWTFIEKSEYESNKNCLLVPISNQGHYKDEF